MPSPSTPSSRASWATITPCRNWSSRRSVGGKRKKPRPCGTGLFRIGLELLAQVEDEHAAQGGECGRRARAGVCKRRIGVEDVVDGDAGPGAVGPAEQPVQVEAHI